MSRSNVSVSSNPLIRASLLGGGWLCVGLGVAGIFLPLLPTTPFLLLSAACFARSSDRFHAWLVEHPRLGPYIQGYLDGSGLPFKAKIYTLVLMWSSLLLTAFVLVDSPYPKVILPLIGVGVSIYIWRLPTRETAPR
ncbi:MAG: hypothetical protein CMI09_05170 [Oceanospirillaceae bacterium]|nr:hypothetical protein [Oceanospirillaceae bacterium]